VAVPTVASAVWVTRPGVNATTYDIPFPAVVAPNDLMYVWLGADGDPGTITAPAGWNVVKSPASTTAYAVLTYLCKGTEGGTTARVTFTAAESAALRVLQIKGARPDLAPQATNVSGTSATPNPPALTVTDSDTYLILTGMVADLEPNHAGYPSNMPALQATVGSWGAVNSANGVRVSVAGNTAGAVRVTADPDIYTVSAAQPWRARTTFIRPGIPPVADFTHAQPDPAVPSVAFTDTSTERPYAWAWTFGDGGTSTLQHPVHVYAAAGTYEVTLIVTNHMGTSPAGTAFVEVSAGAEPLPEGHPPLSVSIGGQSMLDTAHEASWETGRTSWMDTLQPANASLELRGQVDVELGATVILGVVGAPDALWTGYVTDVTQKDDPDAGWSTSVNATDAIGRMGQGEDPTFTVPAGTLATQLVACAARLGFVVDVDLAPSTGTLPQLTAHTFTDDGVLEYLAKAEQASNAIVVHRPDGGLRVLVRAAVPASPPVVPIELSGPDSPSSWSRMLSARDVVNLWAMTWPAEDPETTLWEARDQASIDLYGTKSYTVDESPTVRGSVPPEDPEPVPFPQGLRDAMAVPRWTVPSFTIPITDTAQRALWMEALDWVEFEGELWQLLRVSHQVDRWSWTVELAADATQNAITDAPEPPVEPPPGTTRVTVTLAAPSKDAQLALDPGGVERGAGTGTRLAVGYWQGWRYRTLIDFALNLPAGHVRCVKATLYVTTSGQDQVGFGSDPQIVVRRITKAWNEGTEASNSTANAVRWPGPSTADAGKVTKNVTRSEGVEIAIDVTEMVEAARKAGSFHGFRFHSSNEDSSTRTTEFRSRESGTASDARLVAVYDVLAAGALPGPE
jgi:PKD repeat protein